MAEFLTTAGTTAALEELITKAQKQVVLISPYLKWSRMLLDRLLDADRRGVRIVVVYGKKVMEQDQRQRVEKLKHLSLYFCENLHAKCFFSEKQLIVSSLNLHEFSERTNREMSVLVSSMERVYADAVAEAQSILDASKREQGEALTLKGGFWSSGSTGKVRSTGTGYCIRCRASVPRDPGSPLCDPCYTVWATWSNWEFEEKYCHSCGSVGATSKRRPLCGTCSSAGPS